VNSQLTALAAITAVAVVVLPSVAEAATIHKQEAAPRGCSWEAGAPIASTLATARRSTSAPRHPSPGAPRSCRSYAA
jgi:hypothetical protein